MKDGKCLAAERGEKPDSPSSERDLKKAEALSIYPGLPRADKKPFLVSIKSYISE